MKSKIILVVGSILVSGTIVYDTNAVECGSTGNTFWQVTAPTNDYSQYVSLAADSTNVFYSAGTSLTSRQKSGAQNWVHDFATMHPGRAVTGPFAGPPAVVVCGDDGYAYCLSAGTGAIIWSRSLKRATCSSDSIEAAPAVQFRALSDTNFQAAIASDLVIVGTSYGCSTTTANKVTAIDNSTGNVVWSHNSTGSFDYDKFTGLALDYTSNTVYAATFKTFPATAQYTMIALNSLTGARRWAQDLGSIYVAPVPGIGVVYVAMDAGVLYKLDAGTGGILWQTNITTGTGGAGIVKDLLVDLARGRLYVVDTAGTVHALVDTCVGAKRLWSSNISGALASCTPALLGRAGKLYVGAQNGRAYQLNMLTGAAESYATIYGSSGPTSDVLVTGGAGLEAVEGSSRLLASSQGTIKFICIPWLADGTDKQLVSVPHCSDSGAPSSGLALGGDLGPMTNTAGQSVSRVLIVSNTVCYPFQCVQLLGITPSGIGPSAFTSTNGTTSFDTNSFLAQATGGLPITLSLTMTSSVPGVYVTPVTVSNGLDLHVSVLLTNYVLSSAPLLGTKLTGTNTVMVHWPSPSVGFNPQVTTNLSSPGWVAPAETVQDNGTIKYIIVSPSAGQSFYRLRSP